MGAYARTPARSSTPARRRPRHVDQCLQDRRRSTASHQLVFTNTTPTTAYRGAGRPNVSYLAERLVDEAARVTGIDRITLRRKNLIPQERRSPTRRRPARPTTAATRPVLLEAGVGGSRLEGLRARRREAKRRGKLRGIGCAVFIEPSGGVGQEEIAIRFDANGSLDLFTLSGASGQGHETVFPELVADILGVASDKVTLRASDPGWPAARRHRQLRLALAHEPRRRARNRGARDHPQGHRACRQRAGSGRERSRVRTGPLSRVRDRRLRSASEIWRRNCQAAAEHPLNTTIKINTVGGVPERRACVRGRDRSRRPACSTSYATSRSTMRARSTITRSSRANSSAD